MTFFLLFQDEIAHLRRTRSVVLILSLLPLLILAASTLGVGDEGLPPIVFAAAMGSNLAGMVCGAMVVSSLISELQMGTPVLFAVRPVPRFYLLLARFAALVLTLSAVMGLTLGASALLSAWLWPEMPGLLATAGSALAFTVANALLSGSLGVLLGVASSTMLGGILLYIFLGINLSNLTLLLIQYLPSWTGWSAGCSQGLVLVGVALISVALLAISARVFSRLPL